MSWSSRFSPLSPFLLHSSYSISHPLYPNHIHFLLKSTQIHCGWDPPYLSRLSPPLFLSLSPCSLHPPSLPGGGGELLLLEPRRGRVASRARLAHEEAALNGGMEVGRCHARRGSAAARRWWGGTTASSGGAAEAVAGWCCGEVRRRGEGSGGDVAR